MKEFWDLVMTMWDSENVIKLKKTGTCEGSVVETRRKM